jgi:transposase
MRTQFTELTDAQWQVIEKLVDTGRRRKTSLRSVVNAIRWLAQTGSHGAARAVA